MIRFEVPACERERKLGWADNSETPTIVRGLASLSVDSVTKCVTKSVLSANATFQWQTTPDAGAKRHNLLQ